MTSYGLIGLFLSCAIVFFGLGFGLLAVWIFVACIVDAFRRSEEEFKDRTLWIIILLGSIPVGLPLLAGLIYYFLYRPKLNFL